MENIVREKEVDFMNMLKMQGIHKCSTMKDFIEKIIKLNSEFRKEICENISLLKLNDSFKYLHEIELLFKELERYFETPYQQILFPELIINIDSDTKKNLVRVQK